jgi:hypothetical protein
MEDDMIVRALACAALFAALATGCGAGGPTTGPSKAALAAVGGAVDPDPELTPGELCTRENPDFEEYRYAERIPYCRRHVTRAQKVAIGRAYGVDESEFSLYQFDHFIPLSLGGSNSAANVWPLEYAEARRKARLEQQLYLRIDRGEITQAEAIAAIFAWE